MLISEDYRKQQEKLHENPDYGVASRFFAPTVAQIIDKFEVDELLDYGCGKRRLMESLKPKRKLRIQCYDPGVPEFSESPSPSDMVACIDVLEHIEPHLIGNVLDDLKRVTKRYLFASVDCGPAEKTLPDGRNAHLIQRPANWWLPRLMNHFELFTYQKLDRGFWVLMFNGN